MFDFRLNIPGFRVGLPEDEFGFNVQDDDSAPPAPSVVADGTAYGLTPPRLVLVQAPWLNLPLRDGARLPEPSEKVTADPAMALGHGPALGERQVQPWADAFTLSNIFPFDASGLYLPMTRTDDASDDGSASAFLGLRGPSLDAAVPSGGPLPSPSPLIAGFVETPPRQQSLWPNRQGSSRGPIRAAYSTGNLPTTAPDARTSASVDSGFQLVRSAQAQPRESNVERDESPGEILVLPDGSTIHDTKSPTGKVMSPVADLSAVAAAGRRAGEMYRTMLGSWKTGPGARAYLYAQLALNVGQGGTFDYQRRGNVIGGYTQLPQFRSVANLNVGLFAQQAGFSLEETLEIAGTYAWLRSSNYKQFEPHGLDPWTAQYITEGYRLGESRMFDKRPTRSSNY